MIALGVVIGVALMCAFIIGIAVWQERVSPDFSDAACAPRGACESGEQCAMHDTVFAWARKGRRAK